jgi:trk system potassium uptake protein TrkH
MFDLRPVGYVTGLLVACLGGTMLLPMLVDIYYRNGNWPIFLETGILTAACGTLLALACANGVRERLTIQQTFLLTTGVWLVLPVFGALPFMLGQPGASLTDAFFEAMSGMTTTGSTVFTRLEYLPEGTRLWRSMMQWFGGIGIIVVAMVFLPELRVGGMQIFRSEAFDTGGKVLPRAAQIASRISVIYLVLTVVNVIAYSAAGMGVFDALNHALTTISTGGFSTYDASFGAFPGAAEYVATVFMILASLPFVRYVQIVAGTAQPILRDTQIRTYLWIIAIIVTVMAAYRVLTSGAAPEAAFREGLFNVTSIITGTGYSSADYQAWGAFPVVTFFFIGLIGGCAGSTTCSVKVFRYQLLFASIRAQIGKIHSPHGIFTPRYEGRPVGQDVLDSVMSFFMIFVVLLGVISVLLALTGLDTVTSVSGAAAALANIGPGLGPQIGPAGNFAGLSDSAKWILSIAMLIGRLEIMAVLVILTARFWRL